MAMDAAIEAASRLRELASCLRELAAAAAPPQPLAPAAIEDVYDNDEIHEDEEDREEDGTLHSNVRL